MIKGDSLTLTCEIYPDYEDQLDGDAADNDSLEDLGRPRAREFVWTRSGHVVRREHLVQYYCCCKAGTMMTKLFSPHPR